MTTIDTENVSYKRDIHSKALILSDKGIADDYISRKRMMDRNREQEKELNNLKEELRELRNLVGSIINASS